MIAFEPTLCFLNTSHCRLLFSTELALAKAPPPPSRLFPSPTTVDCMCCLQVSSRGEAYPDLTWRLFNGARSAAGQRWPAQASSWSLSHRLADGVLERLGLHAESAPCCRLLPALFLAPQLPWVERGGEGVGGGVCLVAES